MKLHILLTSSVGFVLCSALAGKVLFNIIFIENIVVCLKKPEDVFSLFAIRFLVSYLNFWIVFLFVR